MALVKITENWDAIEATEKLVQERTGDPQAGFNASTFFFGGLGRALMIPCMYRKQKGKKGFEEFTEKYFDIGVQAKFCPFTGKPLYKEVEE